MRFKLDKFDPKTTVINVVVTFVQGFLAAWVVAGYKLDRQTLTGAAAAAFSVVWNVVIKPILKENKILYN